MCHEAQGKLGAIAFHGNYRIRKRTFETYCSMLCFCCFLLLSHSPLVQAEQLSEYRLKVAFLYNFAAYTEWPNLPSQALNLCIYGEDPFGEHLQHLRQKKVNENEIVIRHTRNIDDLPNCQIVFITRSVTNNLTEIINKLNGMPILTIADTLGTGQQGVILNMAIKEEKVTFEANVAVAKKSNLKLSAQLLRFATEVHQ